MASPSTVSIPQSPVETLKGYLPALVCAIAALTYAATLRFEFVYDDTQQIVGNGLIRSWHSLPLFFKTDVWRFWNPSVVGNYWRPLFMVWLLINYKVFGLNAVGWHATSVLLHVIATYLCSQVARRTTGDAMVATVTAFIFAVHPAHMETVAWVSGATDSLMTVFFLGSFLCFVNVLEGTLPLGWSLLSAALFACAMLCKEPAVILPVLVIAYVALFPKKEGATRNSYALLTIGLYAAVVGCYSVARNHALAGVTHSPILLTFGTLLLTWPSLLWFYLRHLLWPGGLSLYYDQPPVLHASVQHFWLPLFAVVLALGVLAFALRRQARMAIFAGLLLLLPLAPAFVFPALVPVDYAHDRYLYLPCFGFGLLIAMLWRRIEGVVDRMFRSRYPSVVAIVGLVVAFSAATSAQLLYWANDLLLFDRSTQIAPGSLLAFNGLGRAFLSRGQNEQAMQVFRQVLQIDPNNWSALYNVGLYDFLNRNYAEADELLTRAVALNPNDADAAALLADTRNHLGRFAEAEAPIRHAITLRPNKAGYRRVLAESLGGQGKINEAIVEAKADLRAHPEEQAADGEVLQRLRLNNHPNNASRDSNSHR